MIHQATVESTRVDSTTTGPPLADEPLGALTLGGFLRQVCHEHAAREALVSYPSSGPSGQPIRYSYADVWNEACAVARGLIARGVTKETRVGLLATNRPEWVSAMFGITLAGGTCVALSTFASPAELEYQLRVGDVSFLIFERSVLKRDFAADLVGLCPEIATTHGEVHSARLPFLRRLVCIGEMPSPGGACESWQDLLRTDATALAPLVEAIGSEISPVDRALVFFSSGSTAKPKAIFHMHRAAAIQCWRWRRFLGLGANVRTWTANGFFWSGNFAMALGSTFASGGCLVLQRYFVPGEALRLMQAERVNLPFAWPHQQARLAEDPAWNEVDLSSLHYAGETTALRTHPTVRTTWQEPVAAYGNTETLTINTGHASGKPPAEIEGNHGFPLPGNTIRIVDPLTGRVLPRGETGEIAVKGPTLMLGYLRVPAEEVFDAEGFFHTGDGGFIDAEGRLVWQGRLNDIIKTGGANVSPLEIDAVLLECPGVKIAATVGVPHDTLGEMVVACIVPESGATLDESTVRAFVAGRLSSYKVPRRVLFLAESELSLTGSNKVRTAALRELAGRKLTA
jgi:acyl-CoA synthetase (AMP-forming)/AMP-acid ligase II